MRIIADFHIHSRYARATSQQLNIKNLEKYGRIKGLNLLGTGDFTHPDWLAELKKELHDDGTGILKTESGFNFVLQAELSNIYSQDNKLRKIHNIVLAKSFDVVEQVNEHLAKKGNLSADGRPIFGKYPCYEFVEDLKKIDNEIEIIPAHAWTPWFSIFGSNSGFDSVEECFKDQTKHIFALETGLSSDPEMNWRLSQLDRYTLVSNSDLHSFWPWRIGRECNIFEMKELTYKNFTDAMKTRNGFVETIEVDPSFGKYHFTGHRNCNVCLEPKDAAKLKDVCPKCGRKLTVGVLQRVEELADREAGYRPKDAVPFRRIIPLSEILSALLGKAVATQTVWKEYYKLVNDERSEMNILLNVPFEELAKLTDEKIADAIIKNRNGEIEIRPGYDGVYGIPVIGSKEKTEQPELLTKPKHEQKGLDEFY